MILRRDRNDPEARAIHLETIRDLTGRALSNLATLRRATTPYLPLQNMMKALVEAQSEQLAGLGAAERYLETGDLENLTGPGGMLAKKKAANDAIRSFQEQQINFMRENKFIHRQNQPNA